MFEMLPDAPFDKCTEMVQLSFGPATWVQVEVDVLVIVSFGLVVGVGACVVGVTCGAAVVGGAVAIVACTVVGDPDPPAGFAVVGGVVTAAGAVVAVADAAVVGGATEVSVPPIVVEAPVDGAVVEAELPPASTLVLPDPPQAASPKTARANPMATIRVVRMAFGTGRFRLWFKRSWSRGNRAATVGRLERMRIQLADEFIDDVPFADLEVVERCRRPSRVRRRAARLTRTAALVISTTLVLVVRLAK